MVTAVKTNNRMAKKESLPEKSGDGKAGKAAKDPLADHPQLKTTIAQIEKAFGEGSIMPLGAGEVHARRIQGIPTGSLSLDLALGGRGLAQGTRHRDFRTGIERQDYAGVACRGAGPAPGGIAAFIDAEHALGPDVGEEVGR